MSTKTVDDTEVSSDKHKSPYDPIDMAEAEAKQKRLREELAKRQPELLKNLDPEVAAQSEAVKPTADYEVSCIITHRASGKFQTEEHKNIVRAKSEKEAWAKFCDAMQQWPSPRHAQRTIRKVG